MRKILFKGKRKDNGEWVEGFYVHLPRGRYQKDEHLIQTVKENGNIGQLYVVIPETVGQFTGLTDKNGKEIFEGDIVKCSTGRICKVIFFISPSASAFDLVPIGGFDSPPQPEWCLFTDIEVIGNIHDNPELLRSGNDA